MVSEPNRMIGCLLCFDKDCNKGTCINPEISYSCNCLVGFNGDDCSIDIDECIDNNCQNEATCIDEVGMYRCNCSIGYGGQL